MVVVETSLGEKSVDRYFCLMGGGRRGGAITGARKATEEQFLPTLESREISGGEDGQL